MIIKTSQEYASLVPPLVAEEYESLKQSIKDNGLWVPIVINKDGVVLDGHHRFKACQELGIKEPKTETKEFKDKLEETLFVIDCNLTRRHLNNFQRTELALKSKSVLEEIAKQNESLGGKGDKSLTPLGRVDEQIGKRAGVSFETVRKVETLMHKAPERVQESLRKNEISISQAFELYGKGHRHFAEFEHWMFREIKDKELPLYAELFEAGRREGKTDKEIEDDIIQIHKESHKGLREEMKEQSDYCKEFVEGVFEAWEQLTQEGVIEAAKKLADISTTVLAEFKRFAKLEKEGKDLVKHAIGFRHDRWIMTVEDVHTYRDIEEEGLTHTIKDKKNLLWDAYVTTEDRMCVRVFYMDGAAEGEEEEPTLPDIAKHVAGSVCYYTSHKGEERKLIDAEVDYKTNHYRNLGRFILESEDEETDRIVGLKDEPDDPRIIDYQVLYESPQCIKDKKKYSSGEWLIGKKPND